MWNRVRNLFVSLSTYRALSPDLSLRQHVNRSLSLRPALDHHDWCLAVCPQLNVSSPIAEFTYDHLSHYSGLDMARILPSDRLEADLCWSQVCWFDWELRLCDDFLASFGIDLGDRLDEFAPTTIAELLVFLEHQHQWMPPTSDKESVEFR